VLTSALLVVAAALFVLCQLALLALASHRAVQLWRVARGGPGARTTTPPTEWPRVTVQLPVFNERRVVERLIAAAGDLDYPRDRLEIQVLDDSTDDTRERVDRAVARLRERGLEVRVLRRGDRHGYKAGALAAGLAAARGEWIAVFDADFVPARDFLRRLVPHAADPAVGLVQARWGHLNRDHSLLTAAQAVMLDAHFRIEQRSRMAAGLFFSFNGTAGLWRRACIEDAGGWSHDTLTEDLDLSYRAQLRGWRFVYDDGVEAPAELPADIDAFLVQQRRWAKGSIQTARKILPLVWRAPLAARQRFEAAAHLLGNGAHALLLLLSLLLVPLLFASPAFDGRLALAVQAVTLACGLAPVTLFLVAGQRASGRGGLRVARDVGAALVLGAGLALANGRAVLEGLGPNPGAWERTPKTGNPAAGGAHYAAATRSGRGEGMLALFFAAVLAGVLVAGRFQSAPFLALLVAGFGSVALAARRARPQGAPASNPEPAP